MRTLILLWLLVSLVFGKGMSQTNDLSYADDLIHSSDSLNFIGQYREARLLAKKALVIYREHYGKNHIELTKAYEQLGVASLRLWDLETGIAYASRAVEILSLSENQVMNLTKHLNLLALCYYYLEDYQSATVYFDKISKLLYQKFKTYNHDQFISILSNQGGCYFQMNDFERAEELFQKSLDIILSNYGPDDERILGKYNNLGNVQLAKGNYTQALALFKKSLAIKKKLLAKDHSFLTTTYNNLGECYANLGLAQKALLYYQKALQIYEKNQAHCSTNYAESLCSMGLLYQKEQNYTKAFFHYEKALNEMKSCYQQGHPSMTNMYSHLGELMVDLEDYVAAQNYYETAFKILKFDPEKEASYKNRNTAVRVLELLEKRIELFDHLHKQSQELQDVIQQEKDCAIAIEIIDFLRIQYMGNDAKLHILDTYYPLFAKAINVCHQLWEKTNQTLWLEKAFYFSEKSKSVVLLESLQMHKGIVSAGIPDSLIQQEHELKLAISFYEKQIYNLEFKKDSAQAQQLVAFRNKIFDLKQSYLLLSHKFEHQYPAYFRFKYQRKIIELKTIQQKILQPSEALLEYFIGEDFIFCFLIQAETIELFKMKKDFPLEKWVKDLRTNISTYPYRLFEGKDLASKELADICWNLYQKLFAGLELEKLKKIRIIPDGVLGYLPFEILLTKYPAQLSKYRTYAFLLKDFSISYSFSASLLEQELFRKPLTNKRKNLIAFAPNFSQDTSVSDYRNFGNLKHNAKEVSLINQLIQGDVYLGNAATGTNFIEKAQDYKIVHLATHALTNDFENNYSYLVFATPQDSSNYELLHVKDVYDLKLNAEMVVLSACETGIGALKKGEGMISLARGFSYAGAKSIVTTLWNVNDRKTAELMQVFYRHIKKGWTKDEALREAQLAYIQQNRDQYSHPFFWAAFIALGDMQPIDLESTTTYVKMGSLLACLVLLLIIGRYLWG